MKKIDVISNPGDSGPVGGGKINDNFIELIKVLFGAEIWSTNVTEDVLQKLQELPTNNKTSFLAAFKEVFSKANIVDNSLSASLVKTWSITKLRQEFQTHTTIQGAVVEAANKTDLTQFEIGDKFSYWYENDTKYLIGKVKALPISLPADIENKNKILPVYKGMI